MERIRIDRRALGLRARRRAAQDAAAAQLICAAGGGTGLDEELLARIDVLLAEAPAASHPDQGDAVSG